MAQIEVHGTIHSADASSGVEIALFDHEGNVISMAETDVLGISGVQLVTAAGGDCEVFFDKDDDNARDVGETVIRGTLPTTGVLSQTFDLLNMHYGATGAKPHVIAPVGVVDVTLVGVLSQTTTI